MSAQTLDLDTALDCLQLRWPVGEDELRTRPWMRLPLRTAIAAELARRARAKGRR
jgi:hypothetical protein